MIVLRLAWLLTKGVLTVTAVSVAIFAGVCATSTLAAFFLFVLLVRLARRASR